MCSLFNLNLTAIKMSNPTALLSQNRLLQHFVKKSFKAGWVNQLNFVDFRKNSGPQSVNNENTLVLMHGFGLGLGFFFGFLLNYSNLFILTCIDSSTAVMSLTQIITTP
jgi:hypothetical protein